MDVMTKLVRGTTSLRYWNKVWLSYRGFYWGKSSTFPNIAQQVDIGDTGADATWKLRRKVVCTTPNVLTETPGGVCFDVAYVDSGATWSKSLQDSSPTILAVHGCPATHTDVMPIIKPFNEKGCRVIAINMPGYQHTPGVSKSDYDQFMHATSEIAQFLGHFLETMEIPKVDMIVGHSGGALPSTVLAGTSDYIMSIMHICSPPGHTPPASARPHHLIKLLSKVYDTRPGKMCLRPLLPTVNRNFTRLNSDRPSHLMSAVRYVSNIEFGLLKRMAPVLDDRKIPSVFVYSKNDSLVESHLSKKWGKMLGFDIENFDQYGDDFELLQKGEKQEAHDYKKGVLFTRGGHFPQFKEQTALPILIKEAEQLLDVSIEKSKSSA